MTRSTPDRPGPGQATASREDRLKAALKANMARRKAQARVRAAMDDQTAKAPGDQPPARPADRG